MNPTPTLNADSGQPIPDLTGSRRALGRDPFATDGTDPEPWLDTLDRLRERTVSARPQRYEQPARLSFRQVYVNPEAGPSAARLRANEILERLQREGSAVMGEGDRTLLPGAMSKASEAEVAAIFGGGFAGDVLALTGDNWSGPVASSFGLHLVRVEERVSARVPPLAEVRREVRREFEALRRTEANQRFLQELRDRYDVEIRMPSVELEKEQRSVGD